MTSLPSCLGICLKSSFCRELEVDDGKRPSGLLRSQDVAVTGGNGDLHRLHLRLAEQRVPPVRLGEGGAQHRVRILRVAAGGKANLEKTGEPSRRGTSGAASMTKGLPPAFFVSKESVIGTSTVGMVVTAALRRIAADQSVGARADRALERGRRSLCARQRQRQGEEKEQAEGFDSHISDSQWMWCGRLVRARQCIPRAAATATGLEECRGTACRPLVRAGSTP